MKRCSVSVRYKIRSRDEKLNEKRMVQLSMAKVRQTEIFQTALLCEQNIENPGANVSRSSIYN